MKRLVLIDAHAIIHRAFHALPPLTSPDGKPSNAVYGFTSILLRILRELKPDYLIAAFDHPGPTFRHLAFARYKAERPKAPDALYEQIPIVREVLRAFGVPILEKQGYEADDVIGTIVGAVRRAHPAIETVIVTGDLDTLQLVDERTKVFTMKKGVSDTVLYDAAAVRQRYGLEPSALTDFKGLCGDPSDNIPGVKGIGEKTASDLLQEHHSIEELYRTLKKGRLKAKPGVLAALERGEADALFSKTLATIDRNVPVAFVLNAARIRRSRAASDAIRSTLERLGFTSLMRRMGGVSPQAKERAAAPHAHAARPAADAAALPVAERALVLLDPTRTSVSIATAANTVWELPLAALASDAFAAWTQGNGQTHLFDAKSLLRLGARLGSRAIADLMVMAWVADPGRSYDPASLIRRFGQASSLPGDPANLIPGLWAVAPRIASRLQDEDLDRVYETMEAPLIPILASMEERGIGFDPAPLRGLRRTMARELGRLTAVIYRDAGGEFNINSPRQLSEVLFQRLGLATAGLRRTEKSGTLSTRESELQKLKPLHPIVGRMLRYREIAKLKSTYVDALPGLVARDGRIHTTWNQTGTATGRLSSQNPNLQNIPIRSAFGEEIRSAFTARRGTALVAFDYSQLELRIAADLSHDEAMIAAFRKGEDIHRLTAAAVHNIPPERVTPELRYRAKALNFGVLYGMGARSFAESAGITRDEAAAFIEAYFENFRGVKRFIEDMKASARRVGFTATAFGRKRYFPELNATGFRLQREAERQAVNHPIQGTAADIVKKAMIAVEGYLRRSGLGETVRLILQVHDELVFEVEQRAVQGIIPEIRRIMESVWEGAVPMRVEAKEGPNWGALE